MQDLGEDGLPEPVASANTSSKTETITTSVESTATSEPINPAIESTSDKTSAESQEPASSPPPPPPPPPISQHANDRKPVTTKERKPMHIPSSVHVRITPDNLKDYVGPPVYQKDRMYTHAPPPGVSTGLGYLGNGSGAVMPIEAMVCYNIIIFVSFNIFFICSSLFFLRVCQEKEVSN